MTVRDFPRSGQQGGNPQGTLMEVRVSEFLRSGTIVVMGLTVMAAGILVVFYG